MVAEKTLENVNPQVQNLWIKTELPEHITFSKTSVLLNLPDLGLQYYN